jgi:uncharacterized membrane protein YkgB
MLAFRAQQMAENVVDIFDAMLWIVSIFFVLLETTYIVSCAMVCFHVIFSWLYDSDQKLSMNYIEEKEKHTQNIANFRQRD